MTTLDERVAHVEVEVQELRHRVDAVAGAHALGIGLVHADTTAIRVEVQELRGDLNALRVEVGERMTGVEATLALILERLPAPPAAD